ncbi:MAG: hypothetical protein WC733_02105 [Methylophilus sp.]|jgi:hypothetical protein
MPDEHCQWKAKVEEKLDDHHRRISDLSVASEKHTQALQENTKLTKQIADNTGELVELFKGAKMFRKFVLWASPLIVIVYGFYTWIVGAK